MYIHNRTLIEKTFEIWRKRGRFTKNPDLVQLKSGRLLFVYCDNDCHWSQEKQVITIVASDDEGASWYKFAEVDEADLRLGDERLVTPRISLLEDNRLVVLIDHDDFGHFHENQPAGNWLYWSLDGGKSWSEHQPTSIRGFEPDRILNMPDGTLGVVSQVMIGDTMEFALILTCSHDGGETWQERARIASDGYYRVCEGAMVILDDGKELAVVMRENHSAGIPSLVTFSRDGGYTWTEIQMLPFAFHRPYVKQLSSGQTLVAGRNVLGGLGTYCWYGDLRKEAGYYEVGGPRRAYDATLANGALEITNSSETECRYTLLPPESSASETIFEAEVRVDGNPQDEVAFMSLSKIVPFGQTDSFVLTIKPTAIQAGGGSVEFIKKCDMRVFRKITVVHKSGLMVISIDGEALINQCIFREENPLFDFHSYSPHKRTMFGQLGSSGKSYWRSVRYYVKNRSKPDYQWLWSAESGKMPNQYQLDRHIQISGNHPDQKPWPDGGYCSWLETSPGKLFLVDYSNYGDSVGESHIIGINFKVDDIN